MRKIILLTFFSVLTTLSYGQCPDPPSVDSQQFFCSQTAWLLIGENADYLSDLQVFPDVVGWSITWYEDDAGVPGPVIANPNAELLVSGAVYHVTQTDMANCESDPLLISLIERDCACIKDPTFELQDGSPSDRGYTYTALPSFDDHKTCGQGPMNTAPPRARGTTDLMTAGNQHVFVTPGMDPQAGVNVTKTNPDNPSSSHGFRIGRNVSSPATVSSMQKYFIAGEVFVFNFALAMNDPGHDYENQPFAQVNLYDQNNNLVRTRCIVSDPNDCVLLPIGTTSFYTPWSCIKMNTFEYQGQPLRAEFYVADCSVLGGAHWSYMYIDDIYVGADSVGVCENSSFGYALIDDIRPAGQNCFISAQSEQTIGCDYGTSANVAGFPLEVCGVFDAPISQGPPPTLDEISLNIVQNDIVVGTVTNPTPGSEPNTFCFTINETDINVLPYGEFSFEIEIDFILDCGNPYNFFIDDRATATLCPRAGCPLPLIVCDVDDTGFSNFDLTLVEPDIYGNNWQQGDIIITYYENEQDAHDEVGEIPDPTDYDNTVPGGQTIYIRLDWNVSQLAVDCYYLAALELNINKLPELNLLDQYVGCGANFSVTLSGTPTNLSELGTVTYQWFRGTTQLPTTGSFYEATAPGEYTVIVSNFDCEVSHTFTVRQVDFAVNLGQDVVYCNQSNHTIVPTIIEGPDQDPIDPNDVTYLWNTGETTPTITVNSSGTYTLEVFYDGCTVTDSVNVNIGELEVDLGEDVILCNFSAGYQLFVTINGVPQNEVTYMWSTGETTPTITVFDFGVYSVDVDWNGCVETTSIQIVQGQAPEITLGNTITKCAVDIVTLQVQFLETVEGNLTYSWFRNGEQLIGTESSIQVTDFGMYTVIVNNEGCTSEAEVLVEPYPTNSNCIITQGISPEGSPGQNDNLDLGFLASRTGIDNLQIFNRYGTLVYELQNYTNQWVGQTNDGDNLPTGVYFYVINLSGDDPVYGTQTTGTIYINRGMN